MQTFDIGEIDEADLPEHCRTCEVRDLSMCGGLSTSEITRLSEIVTSVEYATGEEIVTEDGGADYVFNVTAGVVTLEKLLADGRRSITGFLFPGDFLGLPFQDAYVASGTAIGETLVCRFPRQKLEGLFSEIPSLQRRLLAMATNDLAMAQNQFLLLGRKTAKERVASFLSALATRQVRRHLPSNPVFVPMTRSDIADYLGLTTETVSRTITQMKNEKLIDTGRAGQIRILDDDALADIAEVY